MPLSDASQSEVGVLGLDVTGRSVAMRLAEQRFKVTAFDWVAQNTLGLRAQAEGPRLHVAASVSKWMAGLRHPRALLLFSGADTPMNLILEQLLPELQIGDLLIDAGVSHFKDTARRQRRLAERGIPFLGLALGGGQHLARQGGIVMAGGGREGRRRARPLLAALASKVRGQPCVSFFETAAAAHFVKMVHAAMEQALLQLLSETFDLLQRTLLLTDGQQADAASTWHFGSA